MKLLVDSSVWVDYLRGSRNRGSRLLDRAIGNDGILVGDLILAEVLRGLPDEKMAKLVLASLERFDIVTLGGRDIAVLAADNYRTLRAKGVTVRGTIDLVVGTWCIVHDIHLLHQDRDYDGMEKWLGLRRWTEGKR